MKKIRIILLAIGLFPVIIAGYYLSALFTPGIKNTIYTMMDKYKIVEAAPFDNYFSQYTVIIIAFFLMFYFVISILIVFGDKARRTGEEQGSSKWESPQRVSKLLSDRSKDKKDPMNLVVFRRKEPNFVIKFFRDIFYHVKTRKAD